MASDSWHISSYHRNRAVYGATDGGHLQIEFRSLQRGPTVIDMLANAARHGQENCRLRG